VSLVPAVLRAGTASNVRPHAAELWFSARNFLEPGARAAFHARLRQEVEAVGARYPDARLTVTAVEGHPSLVNTPAVVAGVAALLRGAGVVVAEDELRFGGEDFAWYLRARPGAFWFLGAHQPGTADHHAPRFNPDPRVFWRGVHFWLVLATAA
jgi:metal-dependent amidase/aminoacylase/carboxypeptidase family protein